ncbi:hypothetical protein [Sedimenticola sp.]|uniref:hypothetical protein n=1 Tax=Sedimenticola sp. TaxID=1940285 RepID=UPI003D112C46
MIVQVNLWVPEMGCGVTKAYGEIEDIEFAKVRRILGEMMACEFSQVVRRPDTHHEIIWGERGTDHSVTCSQAWTHEVNQIIRKIKPCPTNC